MRNYLTKYFQDKHIEFKDTGNKHFTFMPCAACGKDKLGHTFINYESGLWDCKVCGASGNLNQLRKLMGDSEIDLSKYSTEEKRFNKKEFRTLNYNIPIQHAASLWSTGKKFRDYLLEDRKLTEKVLKRFKIGSNGKAITIPLYEKDILVNIQYRRDPALDGKEDVRPRYSQEKGCKAVLFNGDVLREPLREVYITEGAFDALQLIQLGMRNVVSVSLGAGYFAKEWVEQMKDVKTIYLIYDTDQAGKDGAKNTANMLGVDRCKLVSLPLKSGRKKTDITNYFVDDGYTKADFLEVVKNAKVVRSVEEDTIKHISEFNDDLRKRLVEGEYLGAPTGYACLDELMGGLRKGRLVIVSGLTSVGKTSFSLNVCLNLSERKLPTFFFSLEMPPIDIAKKTLMLKAKLTNDDFKDIEDPSEVLDKIDETLKGFENIAGLPIYLYNGSGTIKYKILAECARIVKEEFGVDYIFVDHLHYFARSSKNITAETSQVVRDLKLLAVQLDITIVLLAHLNRSGRATQKKGLYIPSLSDLRDSGAIEQDADQVLFVCRDSENEDAAERQKAFIKVAKNRDGSAGRSASMRFDENLTTFIEEPHGVDYEREVKVEAAEMKKEVGDFGSLLF